ncbi:unnamed protein product [Cunninghamella echinulata]
MELVFTQYPTRRGLKPGKQVSRNFAEVNFKPEDDNYDKARNKSLYFKNATTNLARLSLTGIPFMNGEDIMKSLKYTLTMYGEVIDFGINKEPTTDTVMSTGYVVIDIGNENKHVPLQHKL